MYFDYLYISLIWLTKQFYHYFFTRIIESKNDKYPKGSYIFGKFGWRTHSIYNPHRFGSTDFYLIPETQQNPRSIFLGNLGVPGLTGYFGLTEICKPNNGETLVISDATGAVGSIVGQLAKVINGCKLIGLCNSQEKCDVLLKKFKFHKALDVNIDSFESNFRKATPKGVDCYFDMTGGKISHIVLKQMNEFGRISVCNSTVSHDEQISSPERLILDKQIRIEGFKVQRWKNEWFTGIAEIQKLLDQGIIQHYETVIEGFENMPNAFIQMLNGEHIGKTLVKV